MDTQKEFSFLDIISIASFVLAVENLESNLTQEDKQELQHDLSAEVSKLLAEIHKHLEEQDTKIDKILQVLEVLQ